MMLLVQPKTRPHSPCSAPFPCRRGSKQHVQRGPRPFSSPPPPRPSRLPPSRPLKCMKSMAPRARTALDAPKPLRSRPRRPPPPPPPSRRWPRRKASRPGWRRWRPPGASEAQRPGGNEPLPTHRRHLLASRLGPVERQHGLESRLARRQRSLHASPRQGLVQSAVLRR